MVSGDDYAPIVDLNSVIIDLRYLEAFENYI